MFFPNEFSSRKAKLFLLAKKIKMLIFTKKSKTNYQYLKEQNAKSLLITC